jgi:hypothetical protein
MSHGHTNGRPHPCRSASLLGLPRHDESVTERPSLRTSTVPPYRDYLTEGVTRSEALDACDRIAAETPEVAPAYLRWLVSEVRASGWAQERSEIAE